MHVIAGVLAAPNKVYKGASVSIWADVAGTCIDGAFEFSVCRVAFGMVASPPLQGEKAFVGNGKALLSRQELFHGQGDSRKGCFVTMTG